ncbi:hypothetical protein IFM60648_05515 [Aspergillus lentulus]|uniref:Amino acid transporter transmembrane domain-containing protein n=1 Tax=Aspergillus lentulus TaxID=293939 RepID=A0ABQ1ADM8_ASPLE|nr:hypothetical protein CNMCM8060_006039 [Aspergillus lentulus]KAF4185055.1 hypothetical protein CNMCM7927_007193 [Aspergillus lentulus]KAF4195647.1 hypothetical protein CNMCM8694_005920 [Aspergillus lentulus]GFF79609.1 hypothetical protein IFM60648_05515 [Aspergillus lentulus]
MTSRIVSLSPDDSKIDMDAESQTQPQKPEDMDQKKEEPMPPVRQDAFGDEEFAEVKYKVLKWWQGGLLMVAETISLGILSLPAAVGAVGLAPGLAILISMGILASYNGYVIGQIKLRFPHISSMSDAGEVLLGPFGRELLNAAQILLLIFIMASHILTFTVALNVITGHGTCSIVFGVVGAVISCLLSLPRTLEKVSWLSLVSFVSVFSAVMVTMISIGIIKPTSTWAVAKRTDLVTGFGAVTNMVFAYASHNSFFTFIAELSDPREFPKALALLQSIDISLYIVAAVVIYYFAGEDVTSPALGSTGPLIAKIAYGIALPTIVIAGVINGHIAAKAIYLRMFAGTTRIHKRDIVAVGSWIGIMAVLWTIAWIIAEAIPVFNDLIGLIASLFLSWFTFGLPGVFWLYMNKGMWSLSRGKIFLTLVNVSSVCIGLVVCALGLYASGVSIHKDPAGSVFSCGARS